MSNRRTGPHIAVCHGPYSSLRMFSIFHAPLWKPTIAFAPRCFDSPIIASGKPHSAVPRQLLIAREWDHRKVSHVFGPEIGKPVVGRPANDVLGKAGHRRQQHGLADAFYHMA